MYERLLDEITRVSWTSSEEEGERLHPLKEQLLHQLAQSPAQTLPLLLKALRESDLFRQTTVIEIIDVIGYPANEPAIPALLYQIEVQDPNSPVWQAATRVLIHLGPDVIVPHIIRALLEKGEPYHKPSTGEDLTSWGKDIEGLSVLLSRTTIGSEWASRCCPAINYLLAQIDQDSTTNLVVIDCLLDIVEKVGNRVEYMIPTLLALVKKYPESDVGKRARKLVLSNTQEVLEDYKLLLP